MVDFGRKLKWGCQQECLPGFGLFLQHSNWEGVYYNIGTSERKCPKTNIIRDLSGIWKDFLWYSLRSSRIASAIFNWSSKSLRQAQVQEGRYQTLSNNRGKAVISKKNMKTGDIIVGILQKCNILHVEILVFSSILVWNTSCLFLPVNTENDNMMLYSSCSPWPKHTVPFFCYLY